MKRMLLVWAILYGTQFARGQEGEFTTYSNGLIYSENTMLKLRHIADSLNLKYRTCKADPVFYSISQGKAVIVNLTGDSVRDAVKDMNRQMSIDRFLSRYPTAEVNDQAYIIKHHYINNGNEPITQYRQYDISPDEGISISEEGEDPGNDLTGKWVYEHWKKDKYTKEDKVKAIYFPAPLETMVLPPAYARMIGYADCLIDTTSGKMNEELEQKYIPLPKDWQTMSREEQETLLEELRSSYVVGSCSMDSRPREHAVNIALLSAETYRWEVFLKAHLDILNDRFNRLSDGSYAWAQRETYIRELELMNINTPDLMLGICFRIKNPATHHYYGSLDRVGRALSEAEDKAQIEEAILSIIKDPTLDHFNRMLFYYLFRNYNHYLPNKETQNANAKRLAEAAETLPAFLRQGGNKE